MKVLMLTPYLPFPLHSGGQIRTFNLLKKLAKLHQITLFCLIKNESELQYVPEISRYCHEVRVFRRSQKPFTIKNILLTAISNYPFLVIRNRVSSVIPAVSQELIENDYDLIHAETFYMMPHLPKTETPIILVEQTIESLGYESYSKKAPFFLRPLLNIDIKKIRRWEKHYWEIADRLIVMSEDDKQLIGSKISNEKKIDVVANGVDSSWFSSRSKISNKNPTVLFVGTFKWLPNREAVKYLVEQIWPLVIHKIPSAALHIVGTSPTKQVMNYENSDLNIGVTGNIPDIRDAFATADVLIAPVLSGKGTRYKVLESMASGTPIVATPTAVEGLNLIDGVHVSLGSSAQELANATVLLLKNKNKRKQLATNGKQFVRQQYDWSLISTKLDSVYKKIGSKKYGQT